MELPKRRIENIQDDRLRHLAEGLVRLYEFLCDLDDLPDVDATPLASVADRQGDGLEMLAQLHADIGIRALAHAVDTVPESLLVARLRSLGTPWANIAPATDMNKAGLHKRYRQPIVYPPVKSE